LAKVAFAERKVEGKGEGWEGGGGRNSSHREERGEDRGGKREGKEERGEWRGERGVGGSIQQVGAERVSPRMTRTGRDFRHVDGDD